MDEIKIELAPQELRELNLWVEKLRGSAPDIPIPELLQKVLDTGKIVPAEGEARELYLWHIRFLVQGRKFFKPEAFLKIVYRIRPHCSASDAIVFKA